MRERSAKLVAAKKARASGESSGAAVTPSSDAVTPASTSTTSPAPSTTFPSPSLVSSLQQERVDPSESAFIVEVPELSSDEYESEDDTFDDECAQDIFDEFILSLQLDQRRMLAVLLAESFRTRQGMGIVDAAREAGSIVGYSDKTVRKLRTEFYENKGELKERKQGKYK